MTLWLNPMKPWTNDVMIKTEEATNEWCHHEPMMLWLKLKKPQMNDVMEKYWKIAKNDVIDNHEVMGN